MGAGAFCRRLATFGRGPHSAYGLVNVMAGSDPQDPEEGRRGRQGSAGVRKHDWIARQLRRVYDEALDEDIPDDMMAILAKLDEPSGRGGGA